MQMAYPRAWLVSALVLALTVSAANHTTTRRLQDLAIDIATLAGTGSPGFSSDGTAGTSAALNRPSGVVAAQDDPVVVTVIADSGNHRICLLAGGGIRTVAGTPGVAGFSGDGGSASSATLNSPLGVAFGETRFLIIADTDNNRIRLAGRPSGDSSVNSFMMSTIAGTGSAGFSGDGGPATSAALSSPSGVAFNAATGIVYVADTGNHRVRAILPDGVIVTVAGTGVAGFSGDGGAHTLAALNSPAGVAVSSSAAPPTAANICTLRTPLTAASVRLTLTPSALLLLRAAASLASAATAAHPRAPR